MKIYVALLEKVTNLCGGCFDGGIPFWGDAKKWIVLGHFDAMHTYELRRDRETLFEAIRRNNQRISKAQQSNRYFHPLYLILTEKDGCSWSCENPYLAIARVHFSKSVDVNNTFSALKRRLSTHAKQCECTFTSFHTIELSDMILAISSSKLQSVLEFALSLREFPEVGKVYTYAGVDFTRIEKVEGEGEQAKSNSGDTQDTIDLFSMRFSVKQFNQAAPTLRRIQAAIGAEAEYSVTGVDDVVITQNNFCVSNLLTLYREGIISRSGGFQKDSLWNVTTRVGITMENSEKWGAVEVDESVQVLQKRCEELERKCREIRKGQQWETPLSTLIGTIVRMSRTSLLDEFVYIMYEGIDAFLQNESANISPFELDEIEDETGSEAQFVENLGLLMEHVIRVEGQLTHNPELRPVIYDIPVAMLEYTLAFLQQVSAVLQSKDNQAVRISFLLVPRLCARMKALELFQGTAKLPGLVLVTIPVQSMYEPEKIQRELCHEISHFVGESVRKRDLRVERYGYAAAALAAREFFHNDHQSLIDTVWFSIQNELEQHPEENYMRHLTHRIKLWSQKVLDNTDSYLDLIRRALRICAENPEDYPLTLSEKVSILDKDRVERFSKLLEDLHTLFRETYADVCMLFLLPVDLNKYIKSHVQELRTEPMEYDRPYEQYAIRLFVALTAADCTIPWDYIRRLDKTLYNEMKRLKKLINEAKEDMSHCIPIVSVLNLLDYTKKCHYMIKKVDSEKLDKLRYMFKNMVPQERKNRVNYEMDYESFLGHIDEYRKMLLRSETE